MKKLALLLLSLSLVFTSYSQMDDFYSDTPFDMYLTKNNVRYVFDNDSINQAISTYLPGKNYWTIGFRAQGHGDRFHWAYRNELPELLLGFATNFLSKGKINSHQLVRNLPCSPEK